MQKQQRIECKKWTQAAKGQECTLQIPNICNYNNETTVPCHLPSEIKGGAYKSDDFTVDGCCACHAAIDGDWHRITGGMYTEEDKLFFMLRALQRTMRNRYQREIMKVA